MIEKSSSLHWWSFQLTLWALEVAASGAIELSGVCWFFCWDIGLLSRADFNEDSVGSRESGILIEIERFYDHVQRTYLTSVIESPSVIATNNKRCMYKGACKGCKKDF